MQNIVYPNSIYSKELQTTIFANWKEKIIFLFIIILLISISITLKYLDYKSFNKFNSYIGNFSVINHYYKSETDLYVLKLKNIQDNYTFYTTTEENYRDLTGHIVKAEIFINDDFTFLDYLKGSYHKSNILSLESKKNFRYQLANKIKSLHNDKLIGELYSAIFVATPIGGELRGHLSRLGVSHLAVLSGFHVAFLTGFIFLIAKVVYLPIHQYFFPYRNSFRDIMLVTSLSIVGYLLFIDSPPSFLRAVTMFIVGFILFDRNLLKADFQTLIYASILLLSIFPSLFFSVGFWFSVAGVFYIFLFLQIANYLKLHFLIQMVALNIWVFSAMLPITHSIFPEFYLTQLYSPIWTILFSFIYPLMILLHLVQFPTLFDDILKLFFSIESGEVYNFQTPIYFLILYIFLPIIGILLYNFRDKLKFNKG